MKVSTESLARMYAGARHLVNAAIVFGGSVGVLSVAQQKTLGDGFADVYAGIAQIVHGAGSISQVVMAVGAPIAVYLTTWYAQRSAKAVNQAASLGANPHTSVTSNPDGTANVLLPPDMAGAALKAQSKV